MLPSSQNYKVSDPGNRKILLALLPFWTPLIPPLGISSLKGFLQRYNYPVKTVDANIELEFKEIYEMYFHMLEKYIPAGKRRHLNNMGFEVLRNHMMAHLHYKDEAEYIELIKIVVSKNFFYDIHNDQALKLKEIVEAFYERLETYFLDLIERERPQLLGLSVYNDTLPASLFVFKLTKERFPQIRTVMGGGIFAGELSYSSPNYHFFLDKTPYIDKIIVGEGEKLFLKLLQGELPGSQKVYTGRDISGEHLDLTESGTPDFSDLELNYYTHLASHASRSCPFQCAFCCETTFWGKYRKKNPKQVVEELIELYDKHGIQLFLMCDSLLNPVIKGIAREFINSNISIYWDGYLRVDHAVCSPDNTMIWRRGGFYRARLGIESGSQQVLDLMGKGITIKQIKDALNSLAHAGIKTTTYWVIGYPGETEADFQQTLALIEEMRDAIYEADCNPFQYYLTGQVNSDQWFKEYQHIPLYHEKMKDLLLVQKWNLDCPPGREEIYQRVNRFMDHCNRLGIPNPYSLNDIYLADERWKKLHKNAAPALMEFMPVNGNKTGYIDENKKLRKTVCGRNPYQDDGDWGF
jgi:radical SAM superfamily enzyme YgiQ (UPF0313 family)